MDSLEYSDQAKNVLNRFYNVEIMLYVEGDEDVPFWEFMFSRFSEHKVKVQKVGGKNNFKSYIDDVFSGKINAIIAMDSDLSCFVDEMQHPNIIKTYGYSVENTLIYKETIQSVIRSIGKLSRKEIPVEDCGSWLEKVGELSCPLLMCAIKNEKESCGLSVFGDNAFRFLKGKKTPELCTNKISAHIDGLGLSFSEEEVLIIKEELQTKVDSPTDLVNGHFLFSALLSFVSNTIRKIRSKVSISNESLYGALVLAFESTFNEGHPHYSHYQSSVSSIVLTY